MWTERSFVEDVVIHHKRGYIVAEYPPLKIKAEGGNEREARDALMTSLWASVAHRYEQMTLERFHNAQTIKDMMDTIVYNYYENNPRPVVEREVNMEVIPIMVEAPEGVKLVQGPDGKIIPLPDDR